MRDAMLQAVGRLAAVMLAVICLCAVACARGETRPHDHTEPMAVTVAPDGTKVYTYMVKNPDTGEGHYFDVFERPATLRR